MVATETKERYATAACIVCGYEWQPRRTTPASCPACHARYWQEPAPDTEELTAFDCRKCGHHWTPRRAAPVQCPRCKRTDWREPVRSGRRPHGAPTKQQPLPHPHSDRNPALWDKLVLADHLDATDRAPEAAWLRDQPASALPELKLGRYLAEWQEARRRLHFRMRPWLTDDGTDPYSGKES